MELNEIEAQLTQRHADDPRQGWVEQTFGHGTLTIRVAFGAHRQSPAWFRYWVNNHRVERPTLLAMQCSQTQCPHRTATHEAWVQFAQRHQPDQPKANKSTTRGGKPTHQHTTPVFAPWLAEEVPISPPSASADDTPWTARRARLPVEIRCPHALHEPIRVTVDAWDLYAPHGYVAGGLKDGQPLLSTLDDVRAWVNRTDLEHRTLEIDQAVEA